MTFSIELDREVDGRWIAGVVGRGVADFPDILVYGATREEAIAKAEAAALRVLADLGQTFRPAPFRK